ncbi:MAG: phosphatase PAP2 family protein [Bacteroidales bacterium]
MKKYLFVVILGFVIFIVAYFAGVSKGYFSARGLDIELLHYFNSHRIAKLDPIFQFCTNISSYLCILILVVLLLYATIRWKRQLILRSFHLWLCWILSLVFSSLLKWLIGRPRPFETYDFIEKLSVAGSPSFPSGHTTEVFGIAFGLITIYSKNKVWGYLFLVWAIFIAYTRMYLGVHYPSDVLGGIGIALFSVGLVNYYKAFS